MPDVLKIDELNINQPYKDRSEPYAQYFGIMDLTERQKRARILLAEELEDIFFEFLVFMELLHEYGRGYGQAQNQLETQYKAIMREHLPDDEEFINWYAAAYAANAVETTAKHIRNISGPITEGSKETTKIRDEILSEIGDIVPPKSTVASLPNETEPTESSQTDSWYVSLDRAKFNAENEANTVLNRSDYLKAAEAGYSRKRWLTEHDNRVRPTHQEVEGVTIPIDGIFIVGNSAFRFPRDQEFSPDPGEVISCRCSVKYLR